MARKGRSKTLKDSKTAESEGTSLATFSVTGMKAGIDFGDREKLTFFTSSRAFSIPELLSMVFSLSVEPELAISACVRKTWSDPALDELWKDLDNVFPLLQLVLDLETLRDDDGDRAFLEA
ncbi:hypothetical protein FS837_001447, partial [Tulasnella sp. UAMH 9824]